MRSARSSCCAPKLSPRSAASTSGSSCTPRRPTGPTARTDSAGVTRSCPRLRRCTSERPRAATAAVATPTSGLLTSATCGSTTAVPGGSAPAWDSSPGPGSVLWCCAEHPRSDARERLVAYLRGPVRMEKSCGPIGGRAAGTGGGGPMSRFASAGHRSGRRGRSLSWLSWRCSWAWAGWCRTTRSSPWASLRPCFSWAHHGGPDGHPPVVDPPPPRRRPGRCRRCRPLPLRRRAVRRVLAGRRARPTAIQPSRCAPCCG